MAFSGMRIGEVLQLSGSDIRSDDGVWFIAVHEDDADKIVKSGQRRNVPIHSALIREGFLTYAHSLPDPSAPLFPDKGLDAHGNRGGRGWNVTGKWIRDTIGIDDERKAPNHSFRHRWEDEMRAAEVPEDARDAVVGHARKTTGRLYGIRGEALKRLQRAVEQVKPPAGLFA
ncbi:tyrosine-type recombinase/integrase [Lichenicoccus sp.]|uniref:tyrosine-type recombinase/integrase n=1 Tax=Lichenicoccus sp. TaxID=2781899 RepID=UPI003D12AE90